MMDSVEDIKVLPEMGTQEDGEGGEGSSSGYGTPTPSPRGGVEGEGKEGEGKEGEGKEGEGKEGEGKEGEEQGGGEEERFTFWPYGFQQKSEYEHGKKHPEIMGVTYNGRMRQFVILDSKGVSTWSKDTIGQTVERAMSYPKYEYRLITDLIYVRKYNVYFILSKDFSVKVMNRDFEVTCRVSADLRSVLFMLFNPIKDELITGGVGGTKVWHYHQVANKSWKEIKPMANYKLTLKYDLKGVGGSWVKKVVLDLHHQHLYCCSDTDLHAYDMDGNSLFTYARAHAMSITGCAYSLRARHIVTASADTEVKVWSVSGGLVHTFRGHSQPVTNLVLHPDDSALVITSSLDGTVRLWSLEIMEPLYSLTVSEEGLRWMGLTDDHQLYLSTTRHLTVWSLNTTATFWSLARCHVTSLRLSPGHAGKSTRVVAVGDDSSVRILSRVTRRTVSMVMPPPPISPLSHVQDVTHVRDVNVTYVLLNARHLWLYTNKSDPACRLAVWDLLDIQTKLLEENQNKGQQMSREEEQEKRSGSVTLGVKVALHRGTLDGIGNEAVTSCRSICYLNSPATVWTEEGPCCLIRHTYLLLGLEDGRILFMDPLIKGKKYMELRANKDAITYMEHDEHHASLVTRCDVGEASLLQFWSLPELDLQYEVYCPSDVSVFARMDTVLLTGHKDGSIIRHQLVPHIDDLGSKKPKALRQGLAAIFAQSEKSGHRKEVTSLDACHGLCLFLSASPDGCIKIWDEGKVQLAEIQLEASLTSACFLNQYGDVLVALYNHIFYIHRSKVSRQTSPPEDDEDDGAESDQFDDLSMLNELGETLEPVDMRSYLVPYKSELSRQFKEGGAYTDIEPPPDLNKINDKAYHILLQNNDASEEEEEEEEEEREPPAPSEIYESPRSALGDLELIDMTLSREVTAYDVMGEEAFTSEDSPAAKIKPKRMTPKERRRALRKRRVVIDDASLAMPRDASLGVEMPRFTGSPASTPRHASDSDLDSDSDSDSDCSWFSFSSRGRSTPSDLSWYSDEEGEGGSEEEQQNGVASPGRERRHKQAQDASVSDVATSGAVEVRAAPVRRRRVLEDIRVDPNELMKEEATKRRRERRRARRQADQSAALVNDDKQQEDEGQQPPVGEIPTPTPAAPPRRKVREIKKKEKRASRRVGQSKDVNGRTESEESRKEEEEQKAREEAEAKQEEERKKREEAEKRRIAEEERERKEEERRREEDEKMRRQQEEEEEKRRMELEVKRKAEEEEKKRSEEEAARLEKDKERQKEHSAKYGREDTTTQPSTNQKTSQRKRVVSAAKSGGSRTRSAASSVKKRQKSPTLKKRERPGAKEAEGRDDRSMIVAEKGEGEGGVRQDENITPDNMEEAETEDGRDNSLSGDDMRTLSTPLPELVVGGSMPSPPYPTNTLPNPCPPPSLPSGLPSLPPDPPSSPPMTELSDYPSAPTPPLSLSSHPPTSLASRQQTVNSKKTKTVTFSRPRSPCPMDMSLPTGQPDVQSWLANTTEVDPGSESVTDTRSLTDPDTRSRSPTAWSDGVSEMTVPHVDIQIEEKQGEEEEDDWWWRKSRRRRSVASTLATPVTPAEGLRKRPHTAHVMMEKLTTKELETYYLSALERYKEMVGAPDVENLYQNEGIKFEGNWQDRAIERHLLLKMQRHLRTQSATEKAQRMFEEQQERTKQKIEKKASESRFLPPELGFQLFHLHRAVRSTIHAPSPVTPAPTPAPGHHHPAPGPHYHCPHRRTSTASAATSHRPTLARTAHSVLGTRRKSRLSSAAPSVKTRPATAAGRIQAKTAPPDRQWEKAELGAERPYRCRLATPPTHTKPRPPALSREEIDIQLLDPRNPRSAMYRQRTGASVPSKCSRYVLIEGAGASSAESKLMPTVMEHKLISQRFPEHHEEWLGHTKPPPKYRPPLLLYHPPAFTQAPVI